MATSFTAVLRDQFIALGEDPANFAAEFDRWKSSGERGEYDSPLFGKDGAYSSPPVNGQPNLLRHVHLVPLSDSAQLKVWHVKWRQRARKTSDRALVYASDARHGHLLLFILVEPHAHAIAQMRTPEHRATMQGLAAVAGRFIHDGTIIA